MKKFTFSVTLLFLLISAGYDVTGQENSTDQQGTLLGKGTWLFNLYNPFSFSSYTDKYTGTSDRYSEFSLDLKAGYFFRNNMGAGLNIDIGSSMSDVTIKQVTNRSLIMGSYYQGYQLFGLTWLASAGVGFGSEKVKDKTAGTDQSAGLTELLIETGPMINFFPNQPFSFYPKAGLLYERTKFSSYTENATNFYLGADILFNMGCAQFSPDCKNGFDNVSQRFAGGQNSLSASTMGLFRIGGFTEKYGTQDYKYSTNTLTLDINYRYYIINGLSVGGWTMLNHQYQNQKNVTTPNKTGSTDFIIGPAVTYYLPLGKYWENIYLDLDLGIGLKTQNYYGTKSTDRILGGLLNAGYDFGLSRNLSLLPQIGYGAFGYKNTSSDSQYTEKGIFTSIGLKTNF